MKRMEQNSKFFWMIMDVCERSACFLKSRDPLNNLLCMCSVYIYTHLHIYTIVYYLLAKCYLERVYEQ